jgi:hypothetical protein
MFRFRLLIVEDRVQYLEQCVSLVRGAVPEAIIDTARSINDALRKIEEALADGVVYDLAILDFKLPREIGEEDSIDETICERLSLLMPSTVVSHFTAFESEEEVKAHMKKAHPPGSLRGFFLDKLDDEFADRIEPLVLETLYGLQVEREISRLFGAGDGASREGARTKGQQRGASVTNRIADLCLAIGFAWEHLNSSTRAKVQEHFNVRQSEDGVLVVLK